MGPMGSQSSPFPMHTSSPDPLGQLMRSPRPSSRNGGGLLLRGEREGEGAYLNGTEGREGRIEWTKREGKGIPPPKVKVSRTNTA